MTGAANPPSRPDPYEDPVATAMVDLLAERGYESTTVDAVIERAGVTRDEFARRFADKDDCILKIFEAFGDDYLRRIERAYDEQTDWRSGLRAAAYECAAWMTEHPKAMRFGMVDLLAAESEMIRVRREEVIRRSAHLIERGRAEAADPSAVPDAAAGMAIGAIAQLLTHRVQAGEPVHPVEMVPHMMYLAVRPYIGEEAAQEELSIPPPEGSAQGSSPPVSSRRE